MLHNRIEDELNFILDSNLFKVPRNIIKQHSNRELFNFIMELQDSELMKIVETYILNCIAIR